MEPYLNAEEKQSEIIKSTSRRKHLRLQFMRTVDWDFFTAGTGAKRGFIENISQGGCLLNTADVIEHRRWIRLALKDDHYNVWFTAVGRAIRREDQIQSWDEETVTLHRFGVEFVYQINPVILDRIHAIQTSCTICGNPAAPIPDLNTPNKAYCVLCHLRRACHNLLVQDGPEIA